MNSIKESVEVISTGKPQPIKSLELAITGPPSSRMSIK